MATRSSFMATFPYGVGPWVIQNCLDFPGNVFFVKSGHAQGGDANGFGQTPDNPFLTIDYAIGQCTADNGDVIIVLPGHTETVTAAAGVAVDVAGITLLGVGHGRQRPKVNFTTATTATFAVSAARCRIANLVFTCSIDAQAAMIAVTAADCLIADCEIQMADATYQAVIGVSSTAAADRLRVTRCFIHGITDANQAAGIQMVGGDAIRITDNTIIGSFAAIGCIYNPTTAATALEISRNILQNLSADADNVCINVHASTTGTLADNRISHIDSTSPAPIVAAAMMVSNNYTKSAAGVAAASAIK